MANVNRRKFSSIKVVIPSSPILDEFNSFVVTQIDQIEQLSLMNLQLAQARDLLLPRLMGEGIAVERRNRRADYGIALPVSN